MVVQCVFGRMNGYWLGNRSFAFLFPALFRLDNISNVAINDYVGNPSREVFEEVQWNLSCNRNLTEREVCEAADLIKCLKNARLKAGIEDKRKWL